MPDPTPDDRPGRGDSAPDRDGEPGPEQVTSLLYRLNDGDQSASAELLPLVYEELRRLSAQVFASQSKGHTLQATALVHEAYLRMLKSDGEREDWRGRRHFLAVAAKAMRRVLIDHARRNRADRRGGGARRVTLAEELETGGALDCDLIDLGEALAELAESRERIAQVVEMRFLGGLTEVEIAAELGVTDRTVRMDWSAGRAWLRKRLSKDGSA